jgi:nicotinate-nucleotide adenylyltransferase
MRVALFGGSFNPPHVAHQMAALYVLETAPVDQLWFVPCFKHPFNKSLESFEDRFEMCRLTAAALGTRAQVSDIEQVIGTESRTLRTVRRLQEDYRQHQFSWVIGSDLVDELDGWQGGDELRRTLPLLVVGRAGAGESQAEAETAPVAMPAVSSTDIRQRLRDRKPIQGLVPRTVLDYIYRRGLFHAREPE